MTCRLPIAVAAIVLAAGCAVQPAAPWITAGAQPLALAQPEAAEALFEPSRSFSGKITVAAAQRPGIPHAGLQLPRVSPDGKWIAALQTRRGDAPFDAASPLDGDGLDAVQLTVHAIDGKTPPATIVSPGPCWPAWIDNDRLLLVSYDDPPRGVAALAVFDRRTGSVQRKSFGVRHLFAPAPHPDGNRVAVCGYGNIADDAVIFIADLATLQLHPGPPLDAGAGAQVFPRWIGDNTLLYLELGKDRARLMLWTIGQPRAQQIATLAAPPTIHDAQHVLGGIVDPVSPGLTHYAAYLPAHDAVVITRLRDGSSLAAPRLTRSGAWWNDQWFIAAREDRVELIGTGGDAENPPRLSLLNGRWTPVWADAAAQSLILVGPGDEPARLNVMQLWLVVEKE